MSMDFYRIKLLSKKQIAPLYYECVFEKPSLFDFKAGQYCELTYENNDVFRPYSIASAPYEDQLTFHIKTTDDALSFAHIVTKTTNIDDICYLKPAQGHVTFDANKTNPSIFIAGGVGLAPFYAILKQARHEQIQSRSFAFYWGGATSQDLYQLDILQELIDSFDQSNLTTTIGDQTAAGKILQDFDDLNDIDVYLAGSPDMVFQTIDLLKTIGLKDENLYCDYVQNQKK